MFIKVTHHSEAVEILRRGHTLWCRQSGEGWQLNNPTDWSKRAIRRLIARHYRDARYWTGENLILFEYRNDEE